MRNRIQVQQTGETRRITISPEKKYGFLVFGPFWIIFWFWSIGMGVREMFIVNPPGRLQHIGAGWISVSILVFLLAAAAGLFILFLYLWMLLGRETVIVDRERLIISKSVLGIGWSGEFLRSRIQKWYIDETGMLYEPDDFPKRPKRFGLPFGGVLCMEYESRVIRFGTGLTVAEAEFALEAITGKKRERS